MMLPKTITNGYGENEYSRLIFISVIGIWNVENFNI